MVHYNIAAELCEQQKVTYLIYSACLAVNATQGLTPFVLKNLLNKDSYRFKRIVLLASMVIESSALVTVEKELADAETEHDQI